MFGGCIFQQTVGIPVCINFFPFFAALFLYSHESYFMQGLRKRQKASFQALKFPVPLYRLYFTELFQVRLLLMASFPLK